MTTTANFPHVRIGLLGLTTIAVYGAWFYSYGVLLDPILIDTGWSESGLAATFTGGLVVTGAGSLMGGWLLDRLGSRRVLLACAAGGGGVLIAASYAESLFVFGLLGILGSGLLGGLGFYHITQTVATRLSPDSTLAISRLTIWGALSSPLFLPYAAWLVENYDWRTSLRWLVIPAIALLLITAFGVTTPPAGVTGTEALRVVIRASKDDPVIRRFMVATILIGIAFSTALVYQVPVMTSRGLTLSVAASIAALRGISQLLGRIPLTPIVNRLGARGATRLAGAAVGIGLLLLIGSGNLFVAVLFALVTGFGVGAISPLQGIYTAELFEHRVLGSAMGWVMMMTFSFGAMGPLLAGVLADATGSRLWAVVVGAACAAAGVGILKSE